LALLLHLRLIALALIFAYSSRISLTCSHHSSLSKSAVCAILAVAVRHGQPPLLYLYFNRLALRVVVSFLMLSRTPAGPFLHCSCEPTAAPPCHTLPCHHGRGRACLEP
jgi:hypothetical protein